MFTKIQKNKISNPYRLPSFLASFIAIFIIFSSSLSAQEQIFSVAKVDNRIITNIDLMNRYNLVIKTSRIQLNKKQEKLSIINQILQKMIDEELQAKEAKVLEVELDQEKFDNALKEIAGNWRKSPKDLPTIFKKQSISYESFVEQIKSQILWSDIVRKNIVPKVTISQSEIDELLELRKVKSKVNKYFLSEIFIPSSYKRDGNSIDGKDLAFKLFDELKRGKDFNDIVRQFSRSPTAEFNGEIGWVGAGDVDNKVYQAVSQIKINDITKPIQLDDGYYIFKVTNKKTFSTLADEDLEQVRNIIFNKKLTLLAKGYLMDLRRNAYIEINRDALSKLVD
ncbi:MAG: PPIC-type domain protein [Rickettsiaceae bacterium]|nr:PPIC-type domain protein [Rickettsiaceae bacterium]